MGLFAWLFRVRQARFLDTLTNDLAVDITSTDWRNRLKIHEAREEANLGSTARPLPLGNGRRGLHL